MLANRFADFRNLLANRSSSSPEISRRVTPRHSARPRARIRDAVWRALMRLLIRARKQFLPLTPSPIKGEGTWQFSFDFWFTELFRGGLALRLAVAAAPHQRPSPAGRVVQAAAPTGKGAAAHLGIGPDDARCSRRPCGTGPRLNRLINRLPRPSRNRWGRCGLCRR